MPQKSETKGSFPSLRELGVKLDALKKQVGKQSGLIGSLQCTVKKLKKQEVKGLIPTWIKHIKTTKDKLRKNKGITLEERADLILFLDSLD